MAWLSGWENRVKITISHANIDTADLTHFPVPLVISTAAGLTDVDVSRIFDELGANWAKIAVTKTDGTTEIYVEKVIWDNANEKALLYVSKSDLVIAYAADTNLYLYFDASHADNTTYVAAVGARTEVWDANYMIVLHMEGAAATSIDDATSNNNDVVAAIGSPTYQQTGPLGVANAVDLSGTDQGLKVADSTSLDVLEPLTVECWAYIDTLTVSDRFVHKNTAYSLQMHSSGTGNMRFYNYNTSTYPQSGDVFLAGEWSYIAASVASPAENCQIYRNGATAGSAVDVGDFAASAIDLYLGIDEDETTGDLDGKLSEIRISNSQRSIAWLKACYYAGIDEIVTWGAFENKKAIACVVSTVGTIKQDIWRTIKAAVATIGTVKRGIKRTVAGAVATIGTVGRIRPYFKTIATATVATVGTVKRKAGKRLSAAVQAVGASIRPLAITRAITGAVGTIGSVARSTAKHVADASVATVATVVRGMVWHKYVATAIVSTAGTVARSTGRHLSAIVSTVASVTPRNIKRAISAAVATIGTVPRAITKHVAAATVATVGSVLRGMVWHKLVATAVVSTVGAVKRKTGKIVTGAATAIGLSIRPITVGKHVIGTVATVATIRPVNIWRTITTAVGTVGKVARKTSKHVATAVVSTVGTIWATAVQVVSGGVSTVASVSRKVMKHVSVATVSTVATVSDYLYDIVYAMNQTIRHIYGKVRITYTDPYFSAGVATSADAVADYTYTDQTVDNVTTEEYKWFSLHRNLLDGTFHPLPGDQSISVGWWGTQLSDSATRYFVPTYPKLTITHAARTVASLLVIGDDQLNEYPSNFTIKLYSTGDVLEHTETVTGNAAVLFSRDLVTPELGIVKQELEITRWSRGDSVSKIAQFFTTLEQTYMSEDGDIVSLNMTEQREFSGTTIPQG
ncbi:MAG: LamG-like jellyroll fold domain-containing protein, partial [Patescibacteria group bacterium]